MRADTAQWTSGACLYECVHVWMQIQCISQTCAYVYFMSACECANGAHVFVRTCVFVCVCVCICVCVCVCARRYIDAQTAASMCV